MRNGDASPAVRLNLLGGFQLRHGAREVTPPHAEQRLLGFLAVAGASHRALVSGTLWPEVTEEHALASLRSCLWRLHRALPSLVLARREVIELDPAVAVDVIGLTRTVDEVVHGADDRLDALLPLRGELLPGWYDDWVVAERSRLRLLWLHALELGGAHRLSAGDHPTALRAGLEAVRADPWRESAHLLVARCLVAQGNYLAAVRQIDAYRGVLAENGVRPSAELCRLADSLRVTRP
jgi:DNA-binding SARP family transcriptional activator